MYDPGFQGEQAERRTVEVYVPEGPGPHPWIVYVHGGGLVSVSPNRGEPFATTLQEAGFAVALVGYRLSDPDPLRLSPTRVRHPDHVRDIAEAVRFLVDNAGHPRLNLDPTNRAIMGHSAGAMLSGMLVANPTFLQEVGLQASDWKTAILIDSEAYRLDDIVPRHQRALSPSRQSAFGIERTEVLPSPEARPVGFAWDRAGAGGWVSLYDSGDAGSAAPSGSWLYPELLSGPGDAEVYDRPHPYNASSYHNVAAGDLATSLLLVHGTAAGRAEAARQMAGLARANGRRARVLSTALTHGQINWYFGRTDLGEEAQRYTAEVVRWLRARMSP